MGKHLGLILALSVFAVPLGASALELQSFPAPNATQNFTDPDEKRPFAPSAERDMDRGDAARRGSGFNFSLSGGNNGKNPNFIPGLTVPRQFGPAIDPQTGDPYPR